MIGFFGTLATIDGRLAATADICGGTSATWLVRTSWPVALGAVGPLSPGNRHLVAIHHPGASRWRRA